MVITCSTALQAVIDRMEQMERSIEHMRVDHEESMEQMERSMEQMRVDHEESMEQMEISMEELRLENRKAINIGPEMDQEIDTNAHQ